MCIFSQGENFNIILIPILHKAFVAVCVAAIEVGHGLYLLDGFPFCTLLCEIQVTVNRASWHGQYFDVDILV